MLYNWYYHVLLCLYGPFSLSWELDHRNLWISFGDYIVLHVLLAHFIHYWSCPIKYFHGHNVKVSFWPTVCICFSSNTNDVCYRNRIPLQRPLVLDQKSSSIFQVSLSTLFFTATPYSYRRNSIKLGPRVQFQDPILRRVLSVDKRMCDRWVWVSTIPILWLGYRGDPQKFITGYVVSLSVAVV